MKKNIILVILIFVISILILLYFNYLRKDVPNRIVLDVSIISSHVTDGRNGKGFDIDKSNFETIENLFKNIELIELDNPEDSTGYLYLIQFETLQGTIRISSENDVIFNDKKYSFVTSEDWKEFIGLIEDVQP